MSNLPMIQTPTDSYVVKYPEFVKYAEEQFTEKFWTETEMKVELDRMQLLYELTESELHGVKTVLHLFVKYELIVGEEFWGNIFSKVFPRPEIKRMASVFAAVELGIHAPFYDKLNRELGLSTDEYYTEYVNDPILNERITWLSDILNGEDKILACIIFSFVEGCILFSSFGFLKHFQMNGKNKIPVIVRGTNQSALDEGLHSKAGSSVINRYYKEINSSLKNDITRYNKVIEAVNYLYEHECLITDKIFEKGDINGITKEQLKVYIKYRMNICLKQLYID
jgi:ribonucleotide reductase beta subunit family protein with ferritin-like domain